MNRLFILPIIFVILTSCKKDDEVYANPVTPGMTTYALTSDKASYHPGDKVMLTINTVPAGSFVRYRHLHTVLSEEPLTGTSWSWQAPPADFSGYLVEVFGKENGVDKTIASIAVDVSSDWTKFPRYGFLSSYGKLSDDSMLSVMGNLNRHHINGIQFYDWHYEHHLPLAGTVSNPAGQWKDIANRDTYKSTVQKYISLAHGYSMKAMFYNLCYGALSDAPAAGVSDQWYLYTDAAHTSKTVLNLPAPMFKSNIWLLDPSNSSWQNYLAAKNNDVYSVYDFDGFHVDQLGDWGKNYTYNGTVADLATGYGSFLTAMKSAAPTKRLVMNAVNQFGQQQGIAPSPVDFLYTEVWNPNENYADLARIIQDNDSWANNEKRTVLTAYMDYKLADKAGYFNTPGVLLTNAVIFSFGGSHLELGEHMLCKEYFPNNNLKMSAELSNAMTAYYDFLVAYENLLRDGGSFNTTPVTCTNAKMNIGAWPLQTGKVAVQGKKIGAAQVLHFINFANAAHFSWRDTDGNQTTPVSITGADIEVSYDGPVHKVWFASPDDNHGVPQQLSFTQNGNTIKFTLTQLKYWDMVVIE